MFDLTQIQPNDWKELLTDISNKKELSNVNVSIIDLLKHNNTQSGGGCQYSDYTYGGLLDNNSDYYEIHNNINKAMRRLIYKNTLQPLNATQLTLSGGGGLSTNSINFYDVTDNMNVSVNDIDFTSTQFKNFIEDLSSLDSPHSQQSGGGLGKETKKFLNWLLGIKYRIKKFNGFVKEFEEIRKNLERFMTTFKTESEIYEKRAKENAKMVYEYYVYAKYLTLLEILRDNENEALQQHKVQKKEVEEKDANKFLLFPSIPVIGSKIKGDFNMINDYIKKTEIKIETIRKRIKAQRKIMLRDLKGQKYVLGLFKGKNYFDRLKKDLESNMKALDRVLKKRLLFIEDIEEAKNAIATFNSISKTQKDELFKERADAFKNYEKYKSYFDKITRYNEEYMEPLIEMQNQKADLFAKIQYYKNQFFNFNIDTLNEDFGKWKIQTMSAYAYLKEVTKKSDKFGKELKSGVDDITFMINMLNTQLTKQPVIELVNDWKIIKKNLELCESLQNGVSKTGAAVLNKIANMEPIANVMGDLFNMKTAQAIVDDKINFIHTELESKYQNSDNNYDYVKKLVVKFMKGGATDINSLDGFTPDQLTGIANSFTSLLRHTRRLNAQAGGRRNMMTGKLLTNKTGGAGPNDPYRSLFNFPLNFVTTFDATNDKDTIRSTYKLKVAGHPDIPKYIINVNSGSDFKPDKINTQNGDCDDDIYYPGTDLVMHLRGELLDIGKNIDVDGRTIDLRGVNKKTTEFRDNVLPDILPPGVSHWVSTINVKDVCNTQKFVIDKINPGKHFISDFIYYDWESKTIKNKDKKLYELEKLDQNDLIPGMVQIPSRGDSLYFYNPFRVEVFGRNKDYVPDKIHKKKLDVDPTTPSADSGEDYLLNNIKDIENLLDANHNYLDLDKGDGTTKRITILPLFAKNEKLPDNKLIKSNIYYLVNPFNKQLILSFVNKEDIDNNKNNGGFLKQNTKFEDNPVNIQFIGYNPLNEEQNKLLLTSDNLYYLNYDFNIFLPTYYNNTELGKYLYFNPGMDGYVWEKDNVHDYGVLRNTSTALDVAYNTIYSEAPKRDDYDEDIDLVPGVPSHIDFLKIGDKIKTLSKYKLGPRVMNDNRDDRIRLVYFESINLTMLPIMYYLTHILQTPLGLLQNQGTIPNFDNKMENFVLTDNYKYYIPFKTHYKYNTTNYSLKNMHNIYGLDVNLLDKDNSNYTIIPSLLYKQIYRFVINLSNSNLTKDEYWKEFNLYNNLKFKDGDLTKIELQDIISIKIYNNTTPGAVTPAGVVTPGTPGAVTPGTPGAVTPAGAVTPTGAITTTGATGTPKISESAQDLIEKIKEIAQNNDFNGKVGNILKVSAKFKIGSSKNEYTELDRIFTKALELLNKNLSIENKLLEIPKSVKSYNSKLPSISFVTNKLNVEVRTDGETTSTPNGKELEDLIIKNRDLISDVGNTINMTPKDAVRELTSFINSISRWSPTQGSNPFRYYKDEYKPKFDNFFINKENVEGFIEELKRTIFYRESDENKKILIGKFFKYLPNFVSSKNLSYYKREFGEPTFEYTKTYSESIKKKGDKDKKNKSKKKSNKTPSKKSKKIIPPQPTP
jgi:hypothetical protein